MKWTVDRNNIALGKHFLKSVYTAASDLLLHSRRQWLVVIVQQLLAVKRLQSSQNALANPAHANGANDLMLNVVLVLRHRSYVPFSARNLLVCGHKVADEDKDSHEDMLGDGNDIASRHFGNGDAAVCLVGRVQVDMVRPNTGRDGKF